MKLTAFCCVVVLTATALAANLQSKPFVLQIISDNSTLNGQTLDACHEGALIQGLCPTTSKKVSYYNTFYLNYTNSAHPNTGKLVFNNEAEGEHGTLIIPQALSWLFSFGTNVLGLVFEFSKDIVPISFDSNDQMYISVPKVEANGTPNDYSPVHLYRWSICLYPFEGYEYPELVWVLGDGEPNFEDCYKVRIKRVFQSS